MLERARRIVDRSSLVAAALLVASAGAGCSKSTNPPDAGGPSVSDAATPTADAGKDSGKDSGVGDVGLSGNDAGTPQVDAGAEKPDADLPEPRDAGAPDVDAGAADAGLNDAGATDAGPRFGTEVVRATIGSGQGQIGVDTAEESWQAGPMSFAVASNGEIFILDQINSRINVYSNGKWLRSIPIDGTTYIDMDLMNDSGFVLLDNLVKKKVVVLNTVGTKLHEIALQGSGIPDPAAATGVQYRGDGIWVEVEDSLVRVADSDGAATAARATVQGLYTWDSSRLMQASILGDITAKVSVSGEDKVTWADHTVHYQSAIMALLGLCDDANGNFYLGTVFSDDAGTAPSGAELTVLNSTGEVVKRTPMFAQTRTEEIRRSLRVTADGTAYQLALDDKGAAVRRYDP